MRDHTDITILLDRSGSMAGVVEDVKGGIAEFIRIQKEAGDNATLTLVQFDTLRVDHAIEAQPIKSVEPFIVFEPRGGTPLLDALSDTIDHTGTRLDATPEDERPDKVVFVVYTDGQENSSRHATKAQIKDKIKHQTDTYNWQFIFMSSDLDATCDAASYGINPMVTAVFDVHNHVASNSITSNAVARFRGTGNKGVLSYSGEDRDTMAKAPK